MTTQLRSQPPEAAETAATSLVSNRRPRVDKPLLAVQVAVVVVLFAGWELCARFAGTDAWTSSPSAVVVQLQQWHQDGVLLSSIRVTLVETAGGFALGSLVGAVAGFLLGWMRTVGRVLEPFVVALYTLPKIALAPLFVLWFGIGVLTKVMLAAFLVFFFVFFTTFQGTKSVDKELVDISRVMGAGRVAVMRRIIVPNAAVWVFSGLRLALPYALIGAVVGEFIAAREGVGYLIKEASALLNTAGVFAGLVVLMVLTTLLSLLVKRVEGHVLRWQESGDTG